MINFIKRTIVKFLIRKVRVVSNKDTEELFIISHVTDDGYVSLLTNHGSFLPVSYSVYKRMFQTVDRVYGFLILSVEEDRIELSSGESVFLADINEPSIEDSLDSDYL